MTMEELKREDCEAGQANKSKRKSYGRREYILALITTAGAWMYSRGAGVFPGTWLPLFTAIFILAGVYYLFSDGRRMGREGKLYLILLTAAALWFLVKFLPGQRHFELQDIMPYMVLFLHGAGVYWLLTISGARVSNVLDERCIIDLARGFFAIPFAHFVEIFLAVANGLRQIKGSDRERKKKWRDNTGQIIFGICMSVPVLAIVLPMLSAADDSFAAFTGGFVQLCRTITGNFLEALIFGDFLLNLLLLFCTCYFYGLFYGAFCAKDTKKEESGKENQAADLPFAVMMSFSSAVCGVYALFFLVKFSDIIAKTFSAQQSFVYSEYARQGFFELCWIAVINLGLFYFIKAFFSRWKRMERLVLSLLSAETLGFIILAFSKMCLYISVYGFTFKRVFTSWFMTVLLVAFSGLLYCIWKKGNAIKTAVLFAAVTFLLLAYSNLDVWMNQVNRILGFL